MSEMLVTVVHDDMDCTKYQIKTLRDGLKHVTPKVNFKSCCVWEFTDKVFDENSHVLVILSKQCQSFRRKVVDAFQKYRERCRRVNCRVCVVFEVDGGSNNKRLERSINGENTADVNAEKNNENNSENLIHTENAAVANFKENGTEETSESVEGKADNINTIKESSYETNLKLATANETTVVIEDFDGTSSDDLGSMRDKDDIAVANNEVEMIKNDSGKITINAKVVIDEAMGECSKDPSDIGNDAVLEGGVEMINENLERKFKRKRQCWQIEDDDENINKNSTNKTFNENVIYVKSCDETIQKDPDDETHKACDRTVREDSRCETDKAHDRIMREDSESTTIKIDNTPILDDSESEPHKGNVTMVDSDTGGRAVEEFELATLKQTTVVTSADKDDISEEFEDAIGKENVAVLEKLNQSVKWLPKVCAFLFKTNKRTKSLKCIVPNVKDSSVIRDFRVHLLNSLCDLYIDISESFEQLPPRCCILFREDDDYDLAPSIENIKSETMNIKRTGGTIFEYNRPCTVEPEMQTSNEIMYGRESLVLFMIHLLYVMEVINITTMHGQRLWRIKKETVDCDACETPLEPLEVCDELDCNVTWSFERGRFIGFGLLVCRLHYVNTLKQELDGTRAYLETDTDEVSVVNAHLHDLPVKFSVCVNEGQDKLPTMYWLPKLHKRPYKARFIANSSSCTTTELSKLLTSCLTAIKSHVIRYCETVYETSNKNWFWSIKNSGEVLSKLKCRGFRATSLSTYDFSTLYTTLPHNLIKEKLLDLIEWTFKRALKNYGSLYLACNDRKAFFTSSDQSRYTLWSCQNVCDALSYLLDNIYIRFGTKLYRQIVGIPMGTNCAPLVADLFLYCYERDFMDSLNHDNQADVIEAFNSTSRYLDDLLNIDNPYFEGMVNQIYPPELQLNKANISDTEAPFLDLHLSVANGFVSSKIYDKRDDFDFDIVNFPFLDGDVPRRASYGVYISQLIRFARICNHVTDFNARNKCLTAKLLQQGYRYHKLRKTFSKFYRRHYELISKYNVGLKTLLSEGLSEPEFYGDLVYKFKKLKGINDFSFQFRKIITRYKRIGYNLNVMRQSACLVFNPIMVNNYAAFFNCTPVGRASDSMMAPT